MTVRLVSDEKIAETSSKGNQEKWLDRAENCWYKLDQFGYEALAETAVSALLEKSNIETGLPFSFVSENFLGPGQSLITVNRLLSNFLGVPLKQKLAQLSSDKKRVAFLAEAVAEYTGLDKFPQYLTLLFEVDALFCNDDRHLNNIAVIEQEGRYSYCPIFDNGAGLLSNTRLLQMDIDPEPLVSSLRARPFQTTFTRQRNAARSLTGKQLVLPRLTAEQIRETVRPLLEYYPARDRDGIMQRVSACILIRQKAV